MSSKHLGLALALLGCTAPATAQLGDAARSLYTARLADNAAGRFTGLAAAPLVGVAGVPVLDTVVTWDRLRREGYGPAQGASFAQYAGFLRAYPDWPQATTLRGRAEKLVDEAVSATDRIAFFERFPPQSALARLRLAEAYLTVRRDADARAAARQAWVSTGLDPAAEARLVGLFAADLTAADHYARADRLLWGGQASAAARLLPRLDGDGQGWLRARLALRGNAPDAAVRLAAVAPALRNDPGLVFDRVLWLRRQGDVAAAEALLSGGGGGAGRVTDPDTWLKNRLEFARTAWRAGRFEAAYRIAANHATFGLDRPIAERSLGQRQLYVDTEWLAGWLALRKLGRAGDAVAHFRNVRAASLTPISQSRGDYWTGRALEAAGRAGEAREAYRAAAVQFDFFYGQLAAERLGQPLAIRRTAAPAVSAAAETAFRAEPLVRAATLLGELGDRTRQGIFLRALADRADTPVKQALVAGLARPLDRTDIGVIAAKSARSSGELGLIDVGFPVLDLPATLDSGFTMIHAITRQESQFDRAIASSANAMGLMQLLPGTAAEQAAKQGLPASTARLTTDPIYNVTLGSGYFSRVRDSFGGNHVLAVAAYNAGAGNVRKFIAANGDPRSGLDVVDWIEAIPFAETKNYVQRVLENAVVYDLLHPRTAVTRQKDRLSAYLGKTTPG